MFVRKEDISNRIGHLFEDEMHDLIRNFTLQRFEAGDHEVTKDMIYLRGDVEIIDSGVAQNVYPFIFLSSEEDITLRVRKYSYLLVGKLDHEIFDRAALRQSKASKIRRKNISS